VNSWLFLLFCCPSLNPVDVISDQPTLLKALVTLGDNAEAQGHSSTRWSIQSAQKAF